LKNEEYGAPQKKEEDDTIFILFYKFV